MKIDLTQLLTVFGIGILTVTLIDVLGSISSRRMNYNYAYLSPLSFLAYGFIGYLTYDIATLTWALIMACTVGIYDGTVGWRLSIILNANFGQYRDQTIKMSFISRVTRMLFVSGLCGFVGFFIARMGN